MGQCDLAEQYKNDENLRIRIETHRKYTVGPALEPAIDNVLKLSGTESLLDVGTGPGDFPLRLAQSGHKGRLVGIDSSPGMVAKATSNGSGVKFILADAQALPFDDKTFDVVTARHMLYHVPDIPRALREIRRVLRPGGRFLAITSAVNNMSQYVEALRETADVLRGQLADEIRAMLLVFVSASFNGRNGPPMIEAVFGNVETTFVNSALRFESAEPVVRYFDSCRSLKGVPAAQWDKASETFAGVVKTRLKHGPWTISKSVALIMAAA
jgi:SAM-dependent methyltransferase